MSNVTVNKKNITPLPPPGSVELPQLLLQKSGLEVMEQYIPKNATSWISPAENWETIEFFYVLSGKLSLMTDKGREELSEGDSFYVYELREDLEINAIENTRLLYIANSGVFDGIVDFRENLSELMRQIDAKDSYTYRHSVNVMNYSLAILRKLNPESSAFNDLTTASMFHDVGKVYIPIEILNKPGSFTDYEYQIMKKHPLYSARLIAPKFGNKIAKIAAEHHERLDGSGYPNGLKGDEICFESRIIAVADSFDAMTSLRIYKKTVKSPVEAAQELVSMDDKYDKEICKALLELVDSGNLPIIMT